LPISPAADLWDEIVGGARRESPLWGAAVRPDAEYEPVFSPLAEPRYAVGLETIYEGYLLHYGRPRLFSPPDRDTQLLLGDYLFAHGLVRVAEHEDVEAVGDLAALISLCAQLQADGRDGDGAVWAATAALLGRGRLEEARTAIRLRADPSLLLGLALDAVGRDAVDAALAVHAARVAG
jgi:hypothetical protein